MKQLIFTIALLLLTFLAVGQQQNYVKTYMAREAIKQSLKSNADASVVQQNIQYLDGIGRPSQTVTRQGSPDKYDMVVPVQYDEFGRNAKQYLPYRSPTGRTGSYHRNALTEQAAFMDNHFGAGSGLYGYAATVFDETPLARPLKQGATGASWSIHQDQLTLASGWSQNENEHTTELRYATTTAKDSIKLLRAEEGSISIEDFGLWELTATIVRDENNGAEQEGETVSYVDDKGRTVLQRVKYGYYEEVASDTIYDPLIIGLYEVVETTQTVHRYYETYYIYDDFGQLAFVVPPAAVEAIKTTEDWSLLNDEQFRQKWLFCYEYDHRNRMIAKRIPGADWFFMIYDNRDRLVLTQDGNQRSQKGASITGEETIPAYQGKSYHISNEASLKLGSGFRFAASEGNRFVVSSETDQFSEAAQWAFTKYDFLNRPVLTGIYQTNKSVATLRAEVAALTDFEVAYTGTGLLQGYDNSSYPQVGETDLLSVTYYDDYSFTEEVKPAGALDVLRGQVTGSKTRIFGQDQFLSTVTWYDDRYRPLKLITENHLNGRDVVETTYRNEVSALVSQVVMTHTGDHTQGNLVVVENFTYDHMDRLLRQTHQINNGPEEILVENTYNDLGELAFKRVGNGIQQIDYTYNMRGWLTHVNNGTDLLSNDQFGMQLHYDHAGQFNGNIGRMSWKSMGGNNTNENEQAFVYGYDPLARLKEADYASMGRNDHFNVSAINYDANGNIQTLTRRNGLDIMDQLSYQYEGNQLINVEDAGNTAGFENGVSEALEYTYDANGNMIIDANKGIRSISYNLLNLPEQVVFDGGKQVTYTYDAAGVKLRKTSRECETCTEQTTDYVAGKHFVNGQLSFIQHAEGRVIKDGNNFEYEYNLTDHLGNVRVTVKALEAVGNASYTAAITGDIVLTSQAGSSFTMSHDLTDSDPETVFYWSGYDAESNAQAIDLGITYELSMSNAFTSTGTGTWYLIKKSLSTGPIPISLGTGEHVVGLDGYLYSLVGSYTISHTPPNVEVVQRDDYYPFGLNFGSWNVSPKNYYGFQGQEYQKEVGWHQYKWRNADPALGRFFNIDPLAEQFYYNSTYAFSENKVVAHIELEGLESVPHQNGQTNSTIIGGQYFEGYKRFARESYHYIRGFFNFKTEAETHVNTVTTVSKLDVGVGSVTKQKVNQNKLSFIVDGGSAFDTFFADNDYKVYEKDYVTIEPSRSIYTQDQLKISQGTIDVSFSTIQNQDGTKKKTTEISRGTNKPFTKSSISGELSGKIFLKTETDFETGKTVIKAGASADVKVPINSKTDLVIGGSASISTN